LKKFVWILPVILVVLWVLFLEDPSQRPTPMAPAADSIASEKTGPLETQPLAPSSLAGQRSVIPPEKEGGVLSAAIVSAASIAIAKEEAEARIKGRVLAYSGELLSGIFVEALDLKGNTFGAYTDPNGEYEIEVAQGDYLVAVGIKPASYRKKKMPKWVQRGPLVNLLSIGGVNIGAGRYSLLGSTNVRLIDFHQKTQVRLQTIIKARTIEFFKLAADRQNLWSTLTIVADGTVIVSVQKATPQIHPDDASFDQSKRSMKPIAEGIRVFAPKGSAAFADFFLKKRLTEILVFDSTTGKPVRDKLVLRRKLRPPGKGQKKSKGKKSFSPISFGHTRLQFLDLPDGQYQLKSAPYGCRNPKGWPIRIRNGIAESPLFLEPYARVRLRFKNSEGVVKPGKGTIERFLWDGKNAIWYYANSDLRNPKGDYDWPNQEGLFSFRIDLRGFKTVEIKAYVPRTGHVEIPVFLEKSEKTITPFKLNESIVIDLSESFSHPVEVSIQPRQNTPKEE